MKISSLKSSISKKIVSAIVATALIGSLIPIGAAGVDASACHSKGYANSKNFKDAKIAVLSDPHYYAPELGTTGSAFNAYLAEEGKLIAESSAISAAAVDEIKKSDAKIVLVSGDMTKDGEKLSHQQFAKLLKNLEKAGKKVFVVPGNHDINNPAANSYSGDTATRVENVTPGQFKKIYKDFGFSEAIARDKNSLSYVAEPVPGLRIISMDAALYKDNAGKVLPVTAGAFSKETYNWIKHQLSDAKAKGKTVIGLMHHGLLEHFNGEKQFFGEFVIDNWEQVSTELADLGMDAVFTGHYHAQDITSKTTAAGNKIYDIETGSLVSYPCPYRIVDITKDKLTVETKKIQSINYDTNGIPFQDYAYNFLKTGLKDIVTSMVATQIIRINPVLTKEMAYAAAQSSLAIQPAPSLTSATVNDLLGEAMLKHYVGDEEATPVEAAIAQGMSTSQDAMTQVLGYLLTSSYTDLSEKDNNAELLIK